MEGDKALLSALLDKVKDVSGPLLDWLIEQELEMGDGGGEDPDLGKFFGWEVDGSKYGAFEHAYKKHGAKLSARQKLQFFIGLRVVGAFDMDGLGKRLKLDVKRIRVKAREAAEKLEAAKAAEKPAVVKKSGLVKPAKPVKAKKGVKASSAGSVSPLPRASGSAT